jgi:hypothetical protein
VALTLTASASSGCYSLTVRSGLPVDPSPAVHGRLIGGYVNGLVDEEPLLNPNLLCPAGWAEIRYEVTFLDGLVNSIRGLLYEGTSITIHCALRTPGPPPGPVIVVEPPPSQP